VRLPGSVVVGNENIAQKENETGNLKKERQGNLEQEKEDAEHENKISIFII
jgi:hypothetical protein